MLPSPTRSGAYLSPATPLFLLYHCLECLLEVENVLAVDADSVCCAGPMYVVLFHTVDFRDGERLVDGRDFERTFYS